MVFPSDPFPQSRSRYHQIRVVRETTISIVEAIFKISQFECAESMGICCPLLLNKEKSEPSEEIVAQLTPVPVPKINSNLEELFITGKPMIES